jgi:hypothetical protein
MRSGDEMPTDDPMPRSLEKPDEPTVARTSAKGEGAPDQLMRRYGKLLNVLKACSHVLKTAHCPRSVIDDHARLLDYLESIEHSQVQKILSPSALSKVSPTVSISDDTIRKMSLEDVESLTRSETTTRATLERIAVLRFFTTRGELSSARNRDALIERLIGMIENERTRLTIHKLASGEGRKTGKNGGIQ